MWEMDELLNLYKVNMNYIKDMDEDSFKIMQKSMALVDSSKKLMIKQADVMDEQTKKLDKILKILESRES